MKSLKIAGLCLASMLVMSMALAGNAAAGPLWLLCLEGNNPNNTKYTDSSCITHPGEGSWESVAIGSKSDTVRALAFSLKLLDEGTGAEVECPDAGTEGEGLIDNTNKFVINVARAENPSVNCKLLKPALIGCRETKNLEVVEGVNLPWKGEIFETEKKILATLESTVAGKGAGWRVKCAKIEDQCETPNTEAEYAELVNEVTAGVLLVKARFEEKRKGNCSVGGAKRSVVKGLIAILLANGQGLSVNKQ